MVWLVGQFVQDENVQWERGRGLQRNKEWNVLLVSGTRYSSHSPWQKKVVGPDNSNLTLRRTARSRGVAWPNIRSLQAPTSSEKLGNNGDNPTANVKPSTKKPE